MGENENARMDDPVKKYNLMEREISMETEVQSNVVKNLNYLMFKHNISVKKDLADILGIGAPQLVRIFKGEQTPTVFPFLANVTKYFGYTIDEFLFTDIEIAEKREHSEKDNLPVTKYMKFLGLYQVYYFNTSSYKGRERTPNGDAIRSGVMLVEKDTVTDRYKVIAAFNMKKDKADKVFKEDLMNGKRNASICRQKIASLSGFHVYYGELDLSSNHVYINLSFEKNKDRVQMIFHRPESNSEQYIGGLGTMVSVSKGRNSAPCLQCIAMANESLNVSEEELAAHLLMHYPNIKTYDSIDEIVDFAADLYGKSSEETNRWSKLSDEQKKTLVRNYMDKIVNETVEKNLFRTVIVSDVDDDEFYHYIKKVKANMRLEVK